MKKPTFSQLHSTGSLSFVILGWFGVMNRDEKLELCGKDQADPESLMVHLPDFKGPYECSIWIANQKYYKIRSRKRLGGWRWAVNLESLSPSRAQFHL